MWKVMGEAWVEEGVPGKEWRRKRNGIASTHVDAKNVTAS